MPQLSPLMWMFSFIMVMFLLMISVVLFYFINCKLFGEMKYISNHMVWFW
uniref:ATP synthase F0 subunit 8 n=1 Tax=Eriauchenus workmanni TaxID=3422453 RepID=H2E3N2_9ARAC|nr:ATP synthase F0 subunit 8 [Eriauchenius workmani]